MANNNNQKSKKQGNAANSTHSEEYIYEMAKAPRIDKSYHWINMVPVILFTAVIMMIVHSASYERDLDQFYWNYNTGSILDFFAYWKMVLLFITTGLALILLINRAATSQFAVKNTRIYIPMIIYVLFVILSFIFSPHKDFALLGYNDRFEGTLTILCYMVMFFFIINTVNTEENIKSIMIALGVACGILGLIGLSQGTGHDFFQTKIGKILITSPDMWDNLDSLSFTFKNNEIYQTLYNINYVSFYSALIIPVFGMMLVYGVNKLFAQIADNKNVKNASDANTRKAGNKKQDSLLKKVSKIIGLGLFFALLVYNLIGAKSSGGLLGLGVAFLLAFVVFNKHLLKWWKSVAVMLIIVAIVAACNMNIWMPEVKSSVNSVSSEESRASSKEDTTASTSSSDASTSETEGAAKAESSASADENGNDYTDETKSDEVNEEQQSIVRGSVVSDKDCNDAATKKPYIDYMETGKDYVNMSLNGNLIKFTIKFDSNNIFSRVEVSDDSGKNIKILQIEKDNMVEFVFDDSRFYDYVKFGVARDSENNLFLVITTLGQDWNFYINPDEITFINGFGKQVVLGKVYSIGFENIPNFASGRGYIWSRALGICGSNMIIGGGADTFAINFPHRDYAGKYNADAANIDIIIDKPHNLYLGIWQGTGGISLLAFIAMIIIYLIQSFIAMRKSKYDSWLEFLNGGIILGVIGFLCAALFDDSSINVMPVFYGLMGTSIAINFMLVKKKQSLS